MIRMITDSTADLGTQLAETLGVEVMPLTVHFGTDAYRDGIDLKNDQFFEKLIACETLPTTSQINPEVFIEKFQAYVDAGDDVVAIFLSSELSGTCQSANIARQAVGEEHVFVIDSRTVTMGLGLLVTEACRLRDTGLTAAQLAAAVSALAEKVRLLAVVDTLKYLKMGGRISAATAVVGGILGITPIITVQNGIVESIGKTRGRKTAFPWIETRFWEMEPDLTRGIIFGHTHCPQARGECMDYFADLITQVPYHHACDIGTVVGTHVGPGATGFSFFLK